MTRAPAMDHPWTAWVGRRESREDLVTAAPLAMLDATLDREPVAHGPGASVPPCWHWLYFLPAARASEIGVDGHPRRGGFLPPVELPRRMWAGGRLTFERPLGVGEIARRDSTIVSVERKAGKSGELVFVLVRHEIFGPDGRAVIEEHDIVYRPAPAPGAAPPTPQPAPADARWSFAVEADAVMLFRYSALTFNGHRIHYDKDYALNEEHYPGLVVHGPLLATWLLELPRRVLPARKVAAFSFRALAPVFGPTRFTVNGKPEDGGIALWIADAAGTLAMTATVGFAT